MSEQKAPPNPTLALNTKVEEDFVAPLTAVRGSLEVLRDFSDLDAIERQRFIERALSGCARLEQAVDELARTVYAAGQRTLTPAPAIDPDSGYADRIRLLHDLDIVEIDFAGLEFSSSKIVDDFYNTVEKMVEATDRRWFFLVNYGGCSVWPEAWVAFAHRGKKINVTLSLGTARYDATTDSDTERSRDFAPDFFASREAALAGIEQMKSAKNTQPSHR